jgi:hypothetical protein
LFVLQALIVIDVTRYEFKCAFHDGVCTGEDGTVNATAVTDVLPLLITELAPLSSATDAYMTGFQRWADSLPVGTVSLFPFCWNPGPYKYHLLANDSDWAGSKPTAWGQSYREWQPRKKDSSPGLHVQTTSVAGRGNRTLQWLSFYNYPAKSYSSGHVPDAAHATLLMGSNTSRLGSTARPTLFGPLPRSLWNKTLMAQNVARRRASGQPGAQLQPDLSVLPPDWAQQLRQMVASLQQQQHIDIRGIMLGDELSCRGVPPSNLSSVTAELRRLLSATQKLSDVWLWTNECHGIIYNRHPGARSWIPPLLDVVSVDIYSGISPHWNATAAAAEALAARSYYEQHIFPLLGPKQKVAAVPGLFADSRGSLAAQDQALVAKLRGFEAWAAEDSRLIGLVPWHWDSFGSTFPETQYRRGAESFPRLLAELARLRRAIGHTHDSEF